MTDLFEQITNDTLKPTSEMESASNSRKEPASSDNNSPLEPRAQNSTASQACSNPTPSNINIGTPNQTMDNSALAQIINTNFQKLFEIFSENQNFDEVDDDDEDSNSFQHGPDDQDTDFF